MYMKNKLKSKLYIYICIRRCIYGYGLKYSREVD